MTVMLKGDSPAIEAVAYICPSRECGWFRRYTPKYSWLSSVVEHREYGRISQKQLVLNDINNHVCTKHIEVKNFLKVMGV